METSSTKDIITISFTQGFQKGKMTGTLNINNKITILDDITTKLYLISVLEDNGLSKVNNTKQFFKFDKQNIVLLI